jgi:UDP-N-acetylglucosamine 1-carboxyvinyltransferase
VESLRGCEFAVMGDVIEAGTYMAAAGITRSRITLTGCPLELMAPVTQKLAEAGIVCSDEGEGRILVDGRGGKRPVEVRTGPWPEFPTDMQAQTMALAALAPGISVFTETIYPDRFMHVPELVRLGAEISREDATAVVHGATRLTGAHVMATDLRASAALVLAGLAAGGETHVHRVYHLDRGYEGMEKKLTALGARVRRVPDTEA